MEQLSKTSSYPLTNKFLLGLKHLRSHFYTISFDSPVIVPEHKQLVEQASQEELLKM